MDATTLLSSISLQSCFSVSSPVSLESSDYVKRHTKHKKFVFVCTGIVKVIYQELPYKFKRLMLLSLAASEVSVFV